MLIRNTIGAVLLVVAHGAVAHSAVAAAQSSGALIGAWDIEYPAGQRIQNGASSPVMARGKLTVTQDQDSLTATIERAPGEGPTAPAGAATTLQLRGAMTPQGAVFTQKRIASIISNGEAAKREIVVTWVLNATGDTLTGTLATLIEGGPPSSGPAKITGTRVR